MLTYYELNALPIILKRFKVKNIVISGISDLELINYVLKYCEDEHVTYTAIDSETESEIDLINDYTLNVLPNLNNYDAILINDDPNWYTVYNELEIIKNNNKKFPLVFICHNKFPHKRRDSYINPEIIPDDFKNEYSTSLTYNNIKLYDNYYHALKENTPQNGVLTAIEDFLSKNKSINLMNFKLLDGTTILYPDNSINQIRLGKLVEELEEYIIDYDTLSDIVENRVLDNYIHQFNVSTNDEFIDEIKLELNEKDRLIDEFESQIQIQYTELSYKDSQIEAFDSKLDLKDAQLKNIESQLINSENEIKNLNNQVKNLKNNLNQKQNQLDDKENEFNSQINSLKSKISEIEQKKLKLDEQVISLKNNLNQKQNQLDDKENEFNSQINSLKSKISEIEQNKLELNNQIKAANNEIRKNIGQLKDKDNNISLKDNQLMIKQQELDSYKQRYIGQLSKLDNREYCISCFKEEIDNNHLEIQYLKNTSILKRFLSPFAYIYLILKSNPKEIPINIKLYRALKDSKCFDIGFYLNNNKDLQKSRWCNYFSPELHYVCNGFNEQRDFNKKYYNTHSKKDLLDYILNCP